MKIPKAISNLIDSFERLPGIGPKTAQRLVFHLLHFPQSDIENFAQNLISLKQNTKLCEICKNIDTESPCSICADSQRDVEKIMVVSNPMDVFALEKVGFNGIYHVLHGVIDPLNSIGPEDIYLHELINRLEAMRGTNVELILGTNSSMEGESTAMYISKLIKDRDLVDIRITRIARGIPVGGDIEYADEITLTRALEGRVQF